jgi:predicted lipoprotein with Yx(FWY)xxD motif
MNIRLTVVRVTAGLVLVSLVAACTAGAGTTTAPVASSEAPLAASAEPSASSLPSVAPAPSVSAAGSTGPTASPVAQAGGGGRYGTGATPTPNATPKSTTPAASITIKSGSSALGTVLVGADGLTLYTHAGDSATHSTCTASCASAWPPLLVKAGTKVKGGTGVHGAFTTFKRSDGGTQVTYKGKPLYAWTGDYYPGDTTGQGIGGFSVAKV